MIEQARREYDVIKETDVPMKTRDGVTLLADVYRPDAEGRFPTLVMRSPYGKEGTADPNRTVQFYPRYGYVTVVQDCRGRYGSEGEYDTIFQEINDGYDCVEWAATLPWSNGRVGTTGQSYLALTQYAIMCHAPMPPALQAMAPVSASSDYHASWIYHTGGVMMWEWLVPYAILKGRNRLEREGLLDELAKLDEYLDPQIGFLGQPLTPEWYRHLPISDWGELLRDTAPYFAEHLAHPDDDEYWHRANVNRHAETVSVPILHVGSWYDIFGEGAPNAYRSIHERSGFARARDSQRLIMGPWGHTRYDLPISTGAGDIDFGDAALINLRETLLRWFDYWLKDIDNGIMDGPPVSVFTMGENRWQGLDDWPPPNVHSVRYFFHSASRANSASGDGTLSTIPPLDEPADSYTYDPDDPVPTLGGTNLTVPLGVMDQRPAEERADVLVFTSSVLDQPVEATGPLTVELWASSSAPDTDFTAKLVDVRPDGYAQNIADGIIRARYRDPGQPPTLIEPGEVYRYTIDLWATSHVFLPGHRIRVDVSSSNFPRFERNPNTGRTIATETELIPASQRIFHDAQHPSHIVLPLIPR